MDSIFLNGFGYAAQIAPARGGSLLRLARPALKAESLRTPPDGPLDNPFLYGTPLLFPPNRIAGGRFAFEGRDYALPVNEPATGCFLHGALHRTPFQVRYADTLCAKLFYHAPAGAYMGFPHAFSILLTYRLSERGLLQQADVTNDSPERMPMGLGWHTAFRIPFLPDSAPEDIRLQASVEAEYPRDMHTYLPTWDTVDDSSLRRALNEGTLTPCKESLSRHFRQGNAHRMTLMDVRSGVQIGYDTPDYDFYMIYNGGAGDFICVEPQTWVNDAPHAPYPPEESGFCALEPGDTRRLSSLFSIEKTEIRA